MRRPLALAVFATLLTAAGAVEAERRVISFDPPHLNLTGSSSNFRPGLTEQGFHFSTPGDGVFVQGPLHHFSPINGGNYARFILGAENLSIVHKDGLPFTPHQVDLAEYSGSGSVTFVGKRADRSTVTATFTLDGRYDGNGPGEDFETCVFPASFAQIVELQVPGSIYYLDNFAVTPHGTESPEPPPLEWPLVYDINWNGSPHILNQPSFIGGQRAPSSSVFGTQYVRSAIGPLTDRPLELGGNEAIYDQFGMFLSKNAERYVLEFDMTQLGSSSLAVFLDHTHGLLRTDFKGDGTVTFYNGSSANTFTGGNANAAYDPRAVTHARMDFDLGNRRTRIEINGIKVAEWTMNRQAGFDLRQVRFSLTGADLVGVDNVKISAFDTSPLVLSQTDLVFNTINVGSSLVRPATIINTSGENVIITRATSSSSVFLIETPMPLVVPAGGSVAVNIRATPTSGQTFTGNLEFEAGAHRLLLQASATGFQANVPGTFSTHPATQVILEGQSHTLISNFTGNVPLRYEWSLNGLPIATSVTSGYMLPPVSLAGAGLYRVTAVLSNGERVTSNPANIAVVKALSVNRTIALGDRIELNCEAAGSPLVYEWRRNGTLLETTGAVTVNGSRLVIHSAGLASGGNYTCDVTLSNPGGAPYRSVRGMDATLLLSAAPHILTDRIPHSQVGQNIYFQLVTSAPMTQFSATGLPPGISIHPITGWVFGRLEQAIIPDPSRPNLVAPYRVTFRARNADGEAPPVELEWWVHPLPQARNYAGLVERGRLSIDPQNLGGRFVLSATGNGAVSGSIVVAGKAHPVVGQLAYSTDDGALEGTLQFKPASKAAPIAIRLHHDGEVTSESVEFEPDGLLTGGQILPVSATERHQGLYPAALLPDSHNSLDEGEQAEGLGYLSFKTSRTGAVTYAGRLGDGSQVTGSHNLVAHPDTPTAARLPVYLMPQAQRSFLTGWVSYDRDNVDGELAWAKHAHAGNTTYARGFAPQTLRLIGSLHTPPSRGTTLMDLGNIPQQIEFITPTLPEGAVKNLQVQPNHRVVITGSGQPTGVTMTLNPGTSLFTGSYISGHFRGHPLKATFHGIFVPRLGEGVGTILGLSPTSPPSLQIEVGQVRIFPAE